MTGVKKRKPARKKVPQTGAKDSRQWWKVSLKILALLIWVGASVIVSQLIVGYLMIWLIGVESFQMPVWTAVFSALSYTLAMVLVIFVPPRVMVAFKLVNEHRGGKVYKINNKAAPKPAGREQLGLKGWPTWTDIGLAPVGFIVYLLLAAAVTALFTIFPWFEASEAQDVGFNILNSGVDRVVAFVTLVVVAPIVEEIIFRGWLYGKLRNELLGKMSDMTGMIVAILLTSLLFGLVHMQWNVGVNVFAMSIVLCTLREITGTIYAGILLHILKNGVAFYLLYVIGA